MKTSLIYSKKLPTRNHFPLESVVLYDSVLDKDAEFKAWRKKFEYCLPLKAGESLKTLQSLDAVLGALTKMEIPQTTNLTFVAVGGGSVGDFVGFLASLFLRGRFFVQIPSTWLAAVDSAHGGKNGLNYQRSKNQLGTFYPAQKIYIVENLLKTQPPARQQEALGEVIKASIINSKKTFDFLESNKSPVTEKELLYLLPELIAAKMKIVNADPLEKKGLRRILNLGHTVGHILESYHKLAHGEAVKYGILFSAYWSYQKGFLKDKALQRICVLISKSTVDSADTLKRLMEPISESQWLSLLKKDKKMTALDSLDFIFIKNIGQVFRQRISLKEIVSEIRRQKTEL